MDKGGRGGGQPMRIIFKFYNIIIKSANVDKGGWGKTLIHKMWIKRRVFFLNPSLSSLLDPEGSGGKGVSPALNPSHHATALATTAGECRHHLYFFHFNTARSDKHKIGIIEKVFFHHGLSESNTKHKNMRKKEQLIRLSPHLFFTTLVYPIS